MTVLWQLQAGESRQRVIEQQLTQLNRQLAAETRQLKYQKMCISPFAFFRGTAHLYYKDLHSQQVIERSAFNHQQTITWLQGDLHVENYGLFCDQAQDVVFDLNDFDESFVGSYYYDLYRLATSILLVLDQLDPDEQWDHQALLVSMSAAYVRRLAALVTDPVAAQVKLQTNQAQGWLKKWMKKCIKKHSREKMLDKWTIKQGAERWFALDHPKLQQVGELRYLQLTSAVREYLSQLSITSSAAHFAVVDVARRLNAGTGSLGVDRYYVLIRVSNQDYSEYRIIDVKQQSQPSSFAYLPSVTKAQTQCAVGQDILAKRVVTAQQMMQLDADGMLGTIWLDADSYSLRERSPYKQTLPSNKLTGVERFTALAEQWGEIAAVAHMRGQSGLSTHTIDQGFAAMANIMLQREQQLHQELWEFAYSYSQQVQLDYQVFQGMLDN